jgi:hypothetical protein
MPGSAKTCQRLDKAHPKKWRPYTDCLQLPDRSKLSRSQMEGQRCQASGTGVRQLNPPPPLAGHSALNRSLNYYKFLQIQSLAPSTHSAGSPSQKWGGWPSGLKFTCFELFIEFCWLKNLGTNLHRYKTAPISQNISKWCPSVPFQTDVGRLLDLHFPSKLATC